jgi:hypothetical protein
MCHISPVDVVLFCTIRVVTLPEIRGVKDSH